MVEHSPKIPKILESEKKATGTPVLHVRVGVVVAGFQSHPAGVDPPGHFWRCDENKKQVVYVV